MIQNAEIPVLAQGMNFLDEGAAKVLGRVRVQGSMMETVSFQMIKTACFASVFRG